MRIVVVGGAGSMGQIALRDLAASKRVEAVSV